MLHPDVTGNGLREARQLAGLTQRQLADQAMISQANMSRLERFGAAHVDCSGPVMSAVESALSDHGVIIIDGSPQRAAEAAA